MLPHASRDHVAQVLTQVSAVMFWIKCHAPPYRTVKQPPSTARTTNWDALMDPFGQLKQRLGVPPTTRLYTRAETRTHTVIVWPILAHKNTFWDTHWRDNDMLATTHAGASSSAMLRTAKTRFGTHKTCSCSVRGTSQPRHRYN